MNSDIGYFSDWVRGYTQRQIELRTAVDQGLDGWLQFASDQIVDAIANEVLENFGDPTELGHIPTTHEVALLDASAAVTNVFSRLPGKFRPEDSGAGAIAAGSAGTPFFADIGSPEQITRLLKSPDFSDPVDLQTPPVFDVFDDPRNMLFAHASMVFGLEEIVDSGFLPIPPPLAAHFKLRESILDDPAVFLGSSPGMADVIGRIVLEGDFRFR